MSTVEVLLKSVLEVLNPKTVAPVFGSSSGTGTINPCAKVSFLNSGGTSATITSNGTSYTLEPSESITLDPGLNRRNDTITFTATGTTLKYIYYI